LNLLVIATQRTPLAAPISMAFADVGFRVATLTPYGHVVRRTRSIRAHFSYHFRSELPSILRAIDDWRPDLLVCTDDRAILQLQALHRLTTASDDRARQRVSEIIELSLGPESSFHAIRDKSALSAQVEFEGLRAPTTCILPTHGIRRLNRAFKCLPAELTYPIVIKADR
jgi:hypothetical protein